MVFFLCTGNSYPTMAKLSFSSQCQCSSTASGTLSKRSVTFTYSLGNSLRPTGARAGAQGEREGALPLPLPLPLPPSLFFQPPSARVFFACSAEDITRLGEWLCEAEEELALRLKLASLHSALLAQ
eukprot:3596897-Rhodomonas_salina.1